MGIEYMYIHYICVYVLPSYRETMYNALLLTENIKQCSAIKAVNLSAGKAAGVLPVSVEVSAGLTTNLPR